MKRTKKESRPCPGAASKSGIPTVTVGIVARRDQAWHTLGLCLDCGGPAFNWYADVDGRLTLMMIAARLRNVSARAAVRK